MTHVAPDLLGLATNADGRSFEVATERLRLELGLAAAGDVLRILVTFLTALNEALGLGALERSRRTRLLLETVSLDDASMPALAVAARRWTAEIKNAVAGFLPPHLRRAVYGREPQPPSPPVTPSPLPPTAKNAIPAGSLVDTCDAPRFRTILLLGALQDHDQNHTILERHKLDSLRVDRPEHLERLLDEMVCGVVIARSWWATLPAEGHRAFLERLLQHSSFIWVKLDETGLRCMPHAPLQDICESIRFTDSHQINASDSCRITDFDVENFRRASDVISAPLLASLSPGEIENDEANVLLAATSRCVQERHHLKRLQIQRVPIAVLRGGASSAKLFRIEPDDGGPPLIAKIDGMPQLRDEMERFCLFIRSWDARLNPCLHFHAGIGTIVFTLVDEPGAPGQPAPTLEDRLQAALHGELWSSGSPGPREADIATAIERAVDKLAGLNSRQCTDPSLPSKQWLGLDGLDALLSKGISWHLPALHDATKDAVALRHRASGYAQRLSTRAIVHGDAHLRNVLVRDDREPYFIDYAYSGPGHPCFDLVRLESALLFQCFRMMDDEDAVGRLARALAQDDVDDAAVQARFPQLLGSVGNRLAIRTIIRSRRACLQVLRRFGGSLPDYLAVKFVVACQSLTMTHLQTGVVRGTLRGLAELVESHLPSPTS